MTHAQGALIVTANGKEYKLWVGMSVLADLQANHGQDVLAKLDPPEGASEKWMPDLNIVTDLFAAALERYHADEADRWLVDDIIAQNAGAYAKLMGATTPDSPKDKPSGNGKRPRRVA